MSGAYLCICQVDICGTGGYNFWNINVTWALKKNFIKLNFHSS